MKPDTRIPMTMFDYAVLALVKQQDWGPTQKQQIYSAFLQPRCRVLEATPGTMLSDLATAIDDYTANRLAPEAFAGRLFAIGASYLGQRIVEDMTGFDPPFDGEHAEHLTAHMRSLVRKRQP